MSEEKEYLLTDNKMFQDIQAQIEAQKSKQEAAMNRLKEGATAALKRKVEREKK